MRDPDKHWEPQMKLFIFSPLICPKMAPRCR
jgi:hypothetical protein